MGDIVTQMCKVNSSHSPLGYHSSHPRSTQVQCPMGLSGPLGPSVPCPVRPAWLRRRLCYRLLMAFTMTRSTTTLTITAVTTNGISTMASTAHCHPRQHHTQCALGFPASMPLAGPFPAPGPTSQTLSDFQGTVQGPGSHPRITHARGILLSQGQAQVPYWMAMGRGSKRCPWYMEGLTAYPACPGTRQGGAWAEKLPHTENEELSPILPD